MYTYIWMYMYICTHLDTEKRESNQDSLFNVCLCQEDEIVSERKQKAL